MDRDSIVYMAKLAEQAERFDEMGASPALPFDSAAPARPPLSPVGSAPAALRSPFARGAALTRLSPPPFPPAPTAPQSIT